MLECEREILVELQFDLAPYPSPYRFLERFHTVAGAGTHQWNLARYLIELPLIEQRMLKYTPSKLAACAIYLSQRILNGSIPSESTAWSDRL